MLFSRVLLPVQQQLAVSAGAAFATAVRNGLARGVFSNDAGLGLSASLQAQAEAIDHPAQQGMWAIVETFIDTIIISSMTGFAILFSGVWQSGAGGATLQHLHWEVF